MFFKKKTPSPATNAASTELLIDNIVAQVKEQSLALTQPLPPDPTKLKAYHKNLEAIKNLRGRALFYPYIGSGLGRGALVELADGSVKIDFICGLGPHILGHSHPELIKASLKGSLLDLVMQGNLQMNEVYQHLLDKLIGIASKNSRLRQAWICPSGSMANENALKIVRQKKQGARKILAFERAFAGRTTLMCEITDNPAFKKGLPFYDEVLRVPFCPNRPEQALNTLKSHWDKHKKDISVFMLELMQGDGGYFCAPREFFIPLLDFCKNHGIALWFDEVQTFARSGEFFAFEKLGLGNYPDVCTVGKTLQLSATLWTKEYNPEPGLVSGTFSSSSSSFYSAISVIDVLQPYMGCEGQIQKIHNQWFEKLKKLEEQDLISKIEGWGLMWGASLTKGQDKISQLLQNLFQKGLMCFSCGREPDKRLRFLLPAVVEEAQIDQAYSILQEALLEL